LPLTIGATWIAVYAVLSLLGGECTGSVWTDMQCNALGEVQQDVFWWTLILVAYAIPIWAIWMLISGIGFLVLRRRAKSN
jgi:hypothetical protein